jgi:hypothetical protein
MSADSRKDWAEAHWAPLTGENTELTQFNIWHHRRFGFVDHRDAACANRWLVWTAAREDLRKNSERYQWLKDPKRRAVEFDSAFDAFGVPIDSIIDAAISMENKP